MLKNFYSGKFIVFEGLDGSGKTIQIELLKNFLIKNNYKVFSTKEPTINSSAGKKIRIILNEEEKISSKKLQELFAEDRKEHLKKIINPALKRGKIVISDRYFFSSFAFGASDGVDLDWLIKMNDKFLLPDLTFILKVSPKVCIERIEKRGNKKTLWEKEEKMKKVWQTYQILPNRFRNVYTIDGEKSIEEVFAQIKDIILDKFLNNRK